MLADAGAQVRVRDLVALDCIGRDDRDRIGSLVVAALPSARKEMELSAGAAADLVRRRAPGLGALARDPAAMLRLRAADIVPVASSQPRGCGTVTRAIAVGEMIRATDVDWDACDGAHARAQAFLDSRYGLAMAASTIRPGDTLAPGFRGRLVSIRAGERVRVVFKVGPVRVEREAVAVRPARIGQAVTVRDADGGVFAVNPGDFEHGAELQQ
ncbi:MAG: hypothetical protein FD124_2504 [Alphaproteobacteria bacterium]|nr:MAG: hypothetical protein FD124_2504 [Alphaproteobacteria bacterium]